jgi:hypothetical protein
MSARLRKPVAERLLAALRAAGCRCFIDDGEFLCSPPARPIEWPDDPEQAIDEHRSDLLDLMLTTTETIH